MAEYNYTEENLNVDEVISDDESGIHERRDEYEIIEVELDTNRIKKQKLSVREPKCDSKVCVLSVVGKIALYICYVCNIYICEECLKVHDKMHEFVRVWCEDSERRRMAHMLVETMRSERTRELNIYVEDTKVYGRVNVKHELDEKDCWITGLCGLQDRRFLVVDSDNQCMKIFSSVTNTLLRYIRFASRPWDATEIKQKSTDPNSASGSRSDVFGAARGDNDKLCLLALTFPSKKQIWFIDVYEKPAVRTKTIAKHKHYFSIDFRKDQIFTICRDYVESEYRYSVDILSAEGHQLREIQTHIDPIFTGLAVNKDTILLTDSRNNKILCINMEDWKTISQLDIEDGSVPVGITVDNSNNVYVCGWRIDKVYKLSPDLRGHEPLNLDTDYTRESHRICFTDGKLIVGHAGHSSLSNFVTVVQLT